MLYHSLDSRPKKHVGSQDEVYFKKLSRPSPSPNSPSQQVPSPDPNAHGLQPLGEDYQQPTTFKSGSSQVTC